MRVKQASSAATRRRLSVSSKVTPTEMQRIELAATQLGLRTSEYMRLALLCFAEPNNRTLLSRSTPSATSS